MENIKFDTVEEAKIPKRGKYREQVRRWVERFLKSKDKALQSNEFTDHSLAMSFYDSFKDHVKKNKLPVQVKIRKNNDGSAWKIFLLKPEPEVLSQK